MYEKYGLIFDPKNYYKITLKSGSEYTFKGNEFKLKVTLLPNKDAPHKLEVFDGKRRVFDVYAKHVASLEEGII